MRERSTGRCGLGAEELDSADTHTQVRTPRTSKGASLSEEPMSEQPVLAGTRSPAPTCVWEPAPAVKVPLFSLLCKRCSDYNVFF